MLQENDVEREFQIHRTEHDYALAEFWKWTIAVLIGVTMGCIGFLVDFGIEVLNTNKYTSTATVIASHGGSPPCSLYYTQQGSLNKLPILTSQGYSVV